MSNGQGKQPAVFVPITADQAYSDYGIHCEHREMPTNGERRFRLISEVDGTAYIRTQTGDSFGWQNAHYHKGVAETYIVQTGWIAYAEIRDGVEHFTERKAGEIFTSATFVPHNIYMPARAVIHTVKHGVPVPNPLKPDQSDWWDDTAETKQLQSLTRGGPQEEAHIRALVEGSESYVASGSILARLAKVFGIRATEVGDSNTVGPGTS